MTYKKNEVHQIVQRIPKGTITIPSLIAKALGVPLSVRAIGQEICKCEAPWLYRVVLKGKGRNWDFPHPNDKKDYEKRASFLEEEGIKISSDRRKILDAEKFLWDPNE